MNSEKSSIHTLKSPIYIHSKEVTQIYNVSRMCDVTHTSSYQSGKSNAQRKSEKSPIHLRKVLYTLSRALFTYTHKNLIYTHRAIYTPKRALHTPKRALNSSFGCMQGTHDWRFLEAVGPLSVYRALLSVYKALSDLPKTNARVYLRYLNIPLF